jgi:surface antigen
MGAIICVLSLMMAGCSNEAYHNITGHAKQSQMIESAFQNALEHNKDGVGTVWFDEKTGKSGAVKPLYASYDWAPPCRHFEIAYFYPNKQPTYHYGQACRRGQVWKIH